MSDAAITLRRARPDDAADYARTMGDAAVYPWLLQLPFPSVEAWRARLSEVAAPDRAEINLVAEIDGRFAGSAGLHQIQRLRRRHAALLGISVAPEAQHRGVGRALMQALCDYADGWAQILRIELDVDAENLRAIALYESFGFRREGLHRAYAMRGGVYTDALSMARLHPQPARIGWPTEA
ncbi:MAG: GNAT family N-acetyltransferase [Burkholderiales bacterium]|nr:GNAT family N-acetyltransferase [Burkholderiales bacterium]MDE1925962.1 GNAT family N-acetyltransferase [Burkholderiales bacterium]MDE2158133.1 GNAT family N-acetyltransferase [Burkholderiales bacterium]MDE2505236.1 GNAT family N-acetyltransferase [Burkholderiales bacterium]